MTSTVSANDRPLMKKTSAFSATNARPRLGFAADIPFPPARRGLSNADPAADGTVTLDLNRASNLPCAFTDYATCPVAPAENRLTVAVEAGEKNPP
jgi:hypothetical protein